MMKARIAEGVGLAFAGGAGLALVWPVAQRAEVAAVVADCARASAMIATATGAALAVGFVNHKLAEWAARRPAPYLTATAAAFAVPGAPGLAATGEPEGAALAHEAASLAAEAVAEPATWPGAITEFCFAAKLAGGFGWRRMARYVGRSEWRACLDVLQAAEVLTLPRGNVAPDWRAGWYYGRLRLALKYEGLSLPYPAGPAPVINWRRAPA